MPREMAFEVSKKEDKVKRIMIPGVCIQAAPAEGETVKFSSLSQDTEVWKNIKEQ
jgi:hypothetical protein